MDLGLRGKVGLVTGGSRGIGRAIALRLADEGSAVSICGRTAETLQRTVQDIRAKDVPAHFVVADVTARGEAARFVDESAQVLGGVDVLVCNVGGSAGGSLLESTDDDWRTTFDLNLFHAVAAIRAAVPHMERRGGGSVVIISSISGWKPAPRGQYGAAKAAEIFLAGALCLELAPPRIRVNTLSPGSILFPGGGWDRRQQEDPAGLAAFAQREFPWGRLGTADEIADVAVFLLSDRARWINGAHIPVDGGQGRPSMF